jgi:hypothetical protein
VCGEKTYRWGSLRSDGAFSPTGRKGNPMTDYDRFEYFTMRYRYSPYGEGFNLMLLNGVLVNIREAFEISSRIWKALSAAQWCSAENVSLSEENVRSAYDFILPVERDSQTMILFEDVFYHMRSKAIQGSLAILFEGIFADLTSLVTWHKAYDMVKIDADGYVIEQEETPKASVFYCSALDCKETFSLPRIYCAKHMKSIREEVEVDSVREKIENFPASYQEILNMSGFEDWEAEDNSAAVCPHGYSFVLDAEKNEECGCRNPMEKIELLTI